MPIRIRIDGERRTYRSAQEIESDYALIFTPAVRQSWLALGPATLQSRDGGKLRGSARILFGCGKAVCDDGVRVREVNP